MTTYHKDLVEESDKLRALIVNLIDFKNTSDFDNLSDAGKSRIRNQLRFMHGYFEMLQERIPGFNHE